METLKIKVNSFDKKKLEKLRNILENKQIKDIKNNIKDEDLIEIKYTKEQPNGLDVLLGKAEYNEKEIKLNENLYFKIKLIREKYYRQLLNIIDSVGDIIIKHNGKVKSYTENLEEIEIYLKNYKYMLKMALINYIGTYNFDDIFELNKEDMLEIIKKKYNSTNNVDESFYIMRALGMYCCGNSKLLKRLESKADNNEHIKDIIDRLRKCDKFILICPELIHEFCIDNFEKFKQYGITDIYKLYDIIFDKVLFHEIGHGVFDYIRYLKDGLDKNDEKRANYFASLTFDGTFDDIIKTMTDIQDGEYKDPYLIDDDDIKNKVYEI